MSMRASARTAPAHTRGRLDAARKESRRDVMSVGVAHVIPIKGDAL